MDAQGAAMSTFRLYQGDAIELMRSLPDASIDCIDLDCAYESLERHRAVGTTTRLKKSDASSNEWFPIFRNACFPDLFAEAWRVLKKNTHFYFWCDDETAEIAKPIARDAGLKFWNTIIWAKTKGVVSVDTMEQSDVSIGLGYHYRRSHENILMFEKGKRKLLNLGIADVLCFPRIKGSYPTEKPVDLHKVLIANSTLPGDIVLDPFMGSGSAGSAAIRLGRSFIGGDIKESAVALARQRCLGAGGKEDQSWVPVGEPSAPRKDPSAAAKRLIAVLESGVSGTSDQAHFIREAVAPLDGMFMTGPLPGGPTRHLKQPPDVMPIAEMDGADIALNASREVAPVWCACAGEQTYGTCVTCGRPIEDDGLV
jgi:site-specific DNA-methyltransferase (adenine-specific)